MSDFPQQLAQGHPPTALGPIQANDGFRGMIASGLTQFSATASAWSLANLAIFQAIQVRRRVTVTHMAVEVATQSGNIDVGIYGGTSDAVYANAATRLVSSGSTAVGAAGLQSFNIADTTLDPGTYWLAVAVDNTTACLRSWSESTTHMLRPYGVLDLTSAFALPATAAFDLYGASRRIPWVTAYTNTAF